MARRDNRQPGGQAAAHADETRAGGQWRLRNWRLRTKLTAVLLIPVLTLLTVLGLRVYNDAVRGNELTATSARLEVSAELSSLIQALQRERDLSVRFVAGGRRAGLEALRAARARVDSAAGEFDRALAGARPDLDERAAGGFSRGQRLLQGLGDLRFRVERTGSAAPALFDAYTELLAGLLNIGDRAIAATKDSTLARYELAAAALAKLLEQHSAIRGTLSAALASGSLSAERSQALLSARAKAAAAYDDFVTFATPAQRRKYSATVRGPQVEARRAMLSTALAAPAPGPLPAGIGLARWEEAATRTIDALAAVRGDLHAQLAARADALRGQARTALLVDLGLLVGVLLVAGVLAVLVARSLLRPMRTLRRSALEVAEHRLPAAVHGILTDSEPWPDPGQWQRHLEPVPVFSREELGQIARAFEAVHGEAVRLAGEQAMLRENVNSMFVNLSRRSQDLVERQLAVLDRMEAHEQDSETLGGLFELDHLATRMRRNSENLLVLSGQELDYPVEGSVTAEEVVGAALSEVEQYQRVRARVSPEPSVPAEVASDLVHVLSELLENATAYSPTDSEVSLVSSTDGAGNWHIEITDWGTGMADVEIQRANRRLAEPPEVDVEVSRRMGLYVVARLSARHGIGVRLTEAFTGGISAGVEVPARLVTVVVSAAPAPGGEPETTAQLPGVLRWPGSGAAGPAGAATEVLAAATSEPELGEAAADAEPAQLFEPAELSEPAEPLGSTGPEVPGESPAWPADDRDPSPLETDTPTERLPAYRDVLAEWFQTGADGKLGDLTVSRPRVGAAAVGEYEWPASVDSVWIEPNRYGGPDGPSAVALPKRVPRVDAVPSSAETPAMDETPPADETRPTAEGRGNHPTLPVDETSITLPDQVGGRHERAGQ